MHITLVDATVSQALLHGTHGISEIIHAKLFESSTRKGARVINAIKEGIDLNGCLCGCRQCALGSFALSSKTTKSTLVACQILSTILALEILHAEVHNTIVKILSTKMRVASSSLHFKD